MGKFYRIRPVTEGEVGWVSPKAAGYVFYGWSLSRNVNEQNFKGIYGQFNEYFYTSCRYFILNNVSLLKMSFVLKLLKILNHFK